MSGVRVRPFLTSQAVAEAPSLASATLACRCPRCGRGRLFDGVIELNAACPVCGLDFSDSDVGDGFVVPILIVLGAIVVGLAFWVDNRFAPPLWVHAVIWPVVTIGLALAMMRSIKAFLVVQHFRVLPGPT